MATVLEAILDVNAIPGTSPVHRLWAGTKLLLVLLFGISLAVSGRLWGFAVFSAVILAAIGISRLSLRLLWQGMRPLLLVLVVGSLVLVCTSSGSALAHLGPVVVTRQGIINAVRFPGLLFLLALAAQVVNRTTPPVESVAALGVMLQPLRRLRLPVDELLTMMAISLRFLPILAEEVTRLRQAQAARGLGPGQGSVEARGRAVERWAVGLVHANLRRADGLAEAMEARGYGDADARQFPVSSRHFGALDVLLLAAGLACAVAMFVV